MLSYGRYSFTYTAAGDLRTKTRTDTGAVTTYTYDDFGNLRRVALPGGDVIEYLIDGLNRRIGKRVNGALVQGFLYMNQLEPVAELDGSGNVVARFLYADRPHVPAYIVKGGASYRVIADHLGSVRLVVHSETGVVAQAIEYDEYGRVLSDSNPGFQPFGFAGGIDDRNTGLVRFGVRDFSPTFGRWLATDRLHLVNGAYNRYFYCGGNPLGCVDPDGRVELSLSKCTWTEINFSNNYDNPPTFDVFVHGIQRDDLSYRTDQVQGCKDFPGPDQKFSVDDLVEEIRGHKDYGKNVIINLLACGGGSGDYPLAQQLADRMGNVVVGYPDRIGVSSTTVEYGLGFFHVPK